MKDIGEKSENKVPNSKSALESIKAIMEEAKGKNVFQAIEDPSEWQREIRKEWDRDFSHIK